MADEGEGLAAAPFPALLRAAWATYAEATREALVDVGYEDVPRNGSYVLAATAVSGAPLSEIITQLRVSKQAAGHLIDTLVTRGYLERAVDSEDRRRLTITLTERGREAAAVIRSAVAGVDADLADRVGADFVAHTRATLAALVEHDRDHEE